MQKLSLLVGTLLLALPLVGCSSNGGGGSLCGDEDRAEPFEAGTTRDGENGTLEILVDADEFASREPMKIDLSHYEVGLGRELFAPFRAHVGLAEDGASIFAA